ncbi:hypothetical protein HNQ07_001949 [Deinococcus metalli]|uniref:DUF1540 domain-containing protein n=1 Tax=Deinococcus metalli TaxID=1141878 RepID=A0A7W8KEJ7_9DEIO|nr:DUF1540 domain-containing protein [Deinococcus metalli]MBB5376485.1 hypothetical protein [Deinococcus metalli]GHF43685.1 hypothetical protein GCM10017781_20160 [Deinococcus metalli]
MNENTTVVSRCDATSCRFNSDRTCTAGQIEVSMTAQKAECLTFTPRSDAQGTQPSAQQ